ncbi:MAG: hypothetical protein JWN36_1793 [Microbacteriaceae bacterium]|nr:hypothetical protein [Microbacteriaceae bacterium]
MTRVYQAKVIVHVRAQRAAQFRSKLARLSDALYANEQTAGTYLFASEKDREITLLMAVEASSSSAATSQVDRTMRALFASLDPKAASPLRLTDPAPDSARRAGAPIDRELVFA